MGVYKIWPCIEGDISDEDEINEDMYGEFIDFAGFEREDPM